ncbi:capsid cement protein [Gordonia terrae]
MANENVAVYEPGQDISGRCSAGVTGKRFLKISGNRSSGNVAVAHADAGGRICGVSGRDAASGELVRVMRGSGRVVFVTAAANLSAFQEVEVGTNGQAIVKASGVAVGYAVTAATSGGDAEINLY